MGPRWWWWWTCVYGLFVFGLGREARGFLLQAPSPTRKIKAELQSWLRSHDLTAYQTPDHHIINSFSLKITRASSFDGDASSSEEDRLQAVEMDLREVYDEIKKVEREIEDVGINLKELEKKISDVEKEIQDAKQANDREELAYLRDEKKELLRDKSKLRDEKKQLRDKEKLLRDKEKQLRDEKIQLLGDKNKLRDENQAPASQVSRSEGELLEWLSQKDRSPSPQELVYGLGKSFPLQGRQSVLDKIWEAHEKRYDVRIVQDRRFHPILTFMGQSGIGKSRLLEEHHGALLARAKALKGSPHDTPFAQALRRANVDVRVTFGNGSGWQEDESPQASVAVRMLHSYFAGNIYFTDFYDSLRGFLGVEEFMNLKISKASRLIRADMLQRGEMEPMDNLVLILGIDEIDKVLVEGLSSPEEKRRNLTPLIRALGGAMCGSPDKKDSNVFLCPLVAGVVVGDVEEVIAKSSYLTEPLLPLPLNEMQVDHILKSRQWAPNVFKSPELARCLVDLGGVPLILETFVERLELRYSDVRERDPGISYRAIREETKAYMLQKLTGKFAKKAKTLKELLFQVLWNGEPLSLDSQFAGVSLDALQSSGVLALNSQGRVRIPIIYLELIAQSIPEKPLSSVEKRMRGLALQVLDYEKILRWEAFEAMNRDYFALRLLLARHYGHNSMTVQELHQGAWIEESVGASRVLLDMESIGRVGELSGRYPQSKQDLELGVTYRNADGAACDLVTALGLEGKNPCDTLLMVHECKHTRKGNLFVNAADVKVALKKVERALAESGRGDQPFALVFISNRPFARVKDSRWGLELERANLTNAVVIVRENCVDYFGPSFAPRFMGYLESWEEVTSEDRQ